MAVAFSDLEENISIWKKIKLYRNKIGLIIFIIEEKSENFIKPPYILQILVGDGAEMSQIARVAIANLSDLTDHSTQNFESYGPLP